MTASFYFFCLKAEFSLFILGFFYSPNLLNSYGVGVGVAVAPCRQGSQGEVAVGIGVVVGKGVVVGGGVQLQSTEKA